MIAKFSQHIHLANLEDSLSSYINSRLQRHDSEGYKLIQRLLEGHRYSLVEKCLEQLWTSAIVKVLTDVMPDGEPILLFMLRNNVCNLQLRQWVLQDSKQLWEIMRTNFSLLACVQTMSAILRVLGLDSISVRMLWRNFNAVLSNEDIAVLIQNEDEVFHLLNMAVDANFLDVVTGILEWLSCHQRMEQVFLSDSLPDRNSELNILQRADKLEDPHCLNILMRHAAESASTIGK